jgi:hypothetical protein
VDHPNGVRGEKLQVSLVDTVGMEKCVVNGSLTAL